VLRSVNLGVFPSQESCVQCLCGFRIYRETLSRFSCATSSDMKHLLKSKKLKQSCISKDFQRIS
ncbi:hypothetical protein ACT7CZ_02400, partial [Bacillus cereus]